VGVGGAGGVGGELVGGIHGGVGGVGGFVGDCAMASLKRDIGVKDASDMIPGHGGVIDRINSLIYTAPLFTHFIRYLHF
jgi:phosphatidate cytidylyltransferase